MIQRIDPGPRLSQAVIHNGVAYLAGVVPDDPSADIATQTRQVLATIDSLLARAGSDKTKILRAEIFLASMADFGAMNEQWVAWVPAGQTPARATVQAALAKPEYKIEIVVTAAIA
jgi:enamine deaminase RidA (YjgF/YER057c/UK114 family)